MSEAEVTSLLGNPIAVEPRLSPWFPRGAKTMVYFRPLSTEICRYPMLWIHLDQNGKVQEVYAKEHFLWDDRGVYGHTSEQTWGSAKNVFPS